MSEPIKEGWWKPYQSRKFHYFVEGRALCNGWIFPNYDEIEPDTGNMEKGPDDCTACFKKLLKLRASRSSKGERIE